MVSPDFLSMQQVVVDGNVEAARALADQVVKNGGDLLAAVEQGFAEGIRRVGVLWEEGEFFLPELIQGAEAMKTALAVIGPALRGRGLDRGSRGRIVIGTVQGDLHDIGKGLVATLLTAHGFEVFDLGADVPVERFIAKARETGAPLIAASALLTTTMPVQRDIVSAVKAAGLTGSVRVLVGGSATTPNWAQSIGAAYAENALRAVEVAGEFLR